MPVKHNLDPDGNKRLENARRLLDSRTGLAQAVSISIRDIYDKARKSYLRGEITRILKLEIKARKKSELQDMEYARAEHVQEKLIASASSWTKDPAIIADARACERRLMARIPESDK